MTRQTALAAALIAAGMGLAACSAAASAPTTTTTTTQCVSSAVNGCGPGATGATGAVPTTTQSSSTTTTVAPTTTTAAPTTTTAPPPTTTTAPPAPTVLWQQSGSGISNGPQFTVTKSSWQLEWSYNCSSFGTTGNFIVTVNGYGSASDTTDPGVNELGTSGSGDEHYYDQGTFNLGMNSECNWSVKVVQP